MTKKQTAEVTAVEEVLAQTEQPSVEHNDRWTRQTSVELALQHHKINGGMLTPAQLIDHAKQFHAYISGEQA